MEKELYTNGLQRIIQEKYILRQGVLLSVFVLLFIVFLFLTSFDYPVNDKGMKPESMSNESHLENENNLEINTILYVTDKDILASGAHLSN